MFANDDVLNLQDVDAETRKVCSTLGSIAKQYEPGSVEAQAIKDAACAYIAVKQQGALKRQYDRLRLASSGQLSEEMEHQLRRYGIEPNAIDTQE
jgi:hypothetical protein